MAVVVVGVMAGTSPAMAQKAKTGSSKSQWTKQHKDNVAFGGAIHSLRKQVDSTNSALGTITAASIVALTQLKDGLTQVAATTTNFKYGVIQVGAIGSVSGSDMGTTNGVGPFHFYATPPLYKTGEQSTVTFSIPSLGGLGLGGLKLFAAVRSLNPDSGDVGCRAVVQQNSGGVLAGGLWASWVEGSKTGLFIPMPQSRLTPQNGDKEFPTRLVPTEDNALDLADPQYMATGLSLIQFNGGGRTDTSLLTPQRPSIAAGTGATVNFSCIVS